MYRAANLSRPAAGVGYSLLSAVDYFFHCSF